MGETVQRADDDNDNLAIQRVESDGDEIMKISQAGIDLIKEFEGCRLTAYLDSVGIPTIGYGSTEGVAPGDTISQQEAEEILKEDLQRFERCVTEMVTVMPINQNAFDALVSFAFNLGCNALKNSTLLKLVNAGDNHGAAREFPKWDHAGGRVLAGLTRRRQAEAERFLA